MSSGKMLHASLDKVDLLKVWGCKQLPETYLLQQVQVGGFWNSVPFQRNPYKKVVKIPKLVLSPE